MKRDPSLFEAALGAETLAQSDASADLARPIGDLARQGELSLAQRTGLLIPASLGENEA